MDNESGGAFLPSDVSEAERGWIFEVGVASGSGGRRPSVHQSADSDSKGHYGIAHCRPDKVHYPSNRCPGDLHHPAHQRPTTHWNAHYTWIPDLQKRNTNRMKRDWNINKRQGPVFAPDWVLIADCGLTPPPEMKIGGGQTRKSAQLVHACQVRQVGQVR
eukprot:gene11217-biopygen4428